MATTVATLHKLVHCLFFKCKVVLQLEKRKKKRLRNRDLEVIVQKICFKNSRCERLFSLYCFKRGNGLVSCIT